MDIEYSNYEIQKMVYCQKPSLTDQQKSTLLASIGAWFSTAPLENYYMLLCRDKNDYTVLHFNNMNYMKGTEEVKEILESRGEIVDIFYETGTNSYSCWIRNPNDEGGYDVDMYMLFDYSWGVVEVE